MHTIETDYLVIGAGTAGLAFTDTLIDESDAHVTIVDRQGRPGGHWNDAYSFVRLHQPASFYGVNSMALGSGRKDVAGPNAGLYELASGPEISSYFDRVMQHRLLPSGRVAWFPVSQVLGAELGAPGGPGEREFESLISGRRTRVKVRRKVVDASYMGPSVPATHTPRFRIAPGVHVVPPNALPSLGQARLAGPLPRRFVILGAGKTAMDAIVWLLESGADPDTIQWVCPRDSWIINRVTTQPALEFFDEAVAGQAAQMQAWAEATSVDDLFLRLEACGALLRIDRSRMPTMFHLATVSLGEVQSLRRITQVVRLGRVTALEPGRMLLQGGEVEVADGTVFVDCTASAVEPRRVQPIFQDGRLVLQLARLPQPAFSAALIAYVEAHYDDDRQKNQLCATVPFPYTLADYPRSLMVNLWNQFQWGQDKALRQWVRDSRLDGFGKLIASVDAGDAAKQAVLARFRTLGPAAMANLQKLATH